MTGVQSLCWEDTLEKEMATCSSILAWENPWIVELGGLQSMGFTELNTTYRAQAKSQVFEIQSSSSSYFVFDGEFNLKEGF